MAGSGSSSSSSSSADSILSKLGLKPVTKCTMMKLYIPAFGVAAYTGLSINVMNPVLVTRVFPKVDVTNFLLGSALIGTGSYIFTREHMKLAPDCPRVLYSLTGAVLLNFGSVLIWAVVRSVIPPNSTLCTLAGIGTGLAALKVGHSYLSFVDEQVSKK